MAIDLNLLRSKSIGPSPAGPLSLRPSPARTSRFVAGKGHGLTLDKKRKAGARAGLGRAGRKPKVYATVGTGGTHPRGPGAFTPPSASVRLPNRAGPAAVVGKAGFLGKFFKRFRGGST